MKAWHFTANMLRDGRAVPPAGERLVHHGKLVMCETGLHASVRVVDALKYAPGSFIHRVSVGGSIIRSTDKLVCSERTILWSVNGCELLYRFARGCALSVIHLWDAPAQLEGAVNNSVRAARDAAGAARDAWGIRILPFGGVVPRDWIVGDPLAAAEAAQESHLRRLIYRHHRAQRREG